MQTDRRQTRTQQRQYRSTGYGERTVAGARLSRRAVVTPVLIALNVLIYLVTAAQAGSAMQNQAAPLFTDWVLWPASVAVDNEWWRLLTSGFLHFGIIHIAVNMFSLYIVGREIEIVLGKVRYLAVYVLSLLGGSAMVYAFGNVAQTTAGASGAIFGLLGAILIAVLRLRLNPTATIGVIVLNLVLSVSIPGISLLAHLGGLVTGALIAVAMLYAPEKGRVQVQTAAVVVLALAVAGLVIHRDSQLAELTCRYVGSQVVCST